ncbi:hypothetical protein [Streptomyces sp. NPDC056660]|uniref:hypothetical protein n=1 Tax=Streptomyces sp. NPDC056660 TaxID=3345897 RepID=UPI00367D9F5C
MGRAAGEAWEQVRSAVLVSLSLPGEAGGYVAARVVVVDGACRGVVGGVLDSA